MINLMQILLPYQRKLVVNPSRRKCWLSSRQIGKSFACAFVAVFKALSNKNGLSLCISTGSRSASELLKKCSLMAQSINILDPTITFQASSDTLRFNNGSRVISLPSGNPSALRGWSANCIIIDEAAFIERPEDVWSSIAPTLTRDPNSELIMTTTPAGMCGWFHDMYIKAVSDPNWYVQTTTIADAQRDGLDVDMEELKKTISDPLVWNQEFMCQFAKEYGAMLDTSLLEFQDPPEDIQSLPNWIGMDVGSTSDRTAMVDLVQLKDNTLFVKDVTIMHKASYQEQLDILRQKHETSRYIGGYIDANGIGSALAEFANKNVSAKLKPFIWTSSNKTPAYEKLRGLVFDHKIRFATHLKELLVHDVQNVHRIVNEAGKVSYSAGHDANGHSDATSALVLSILSNKQFPCEMATPQGFQSNSAFGRYDPRMFG